MASESSMTLNAGRTTTAFFPAPALSRRGGGKRHRWSKNSADLARRSLSASRLLVSLTLLALLPNRAGACSVPVFRYALEHWKADACQAVVFHRGPLTKTQQALVRDLGPGGLAGELRANLSPRTIDLDGKPDASALAVWQQTGGDSLPWLTVTFPSTARAANSLWSGPLNQQTLGRLLDSPARKEVAQRLGQGESAVWVMIDSGDPTKDESTAGLLKTRLDYLQQTLELPKLDAQDITNGLVSVGQEGLRLAFSLVRLSRDDAEEQAFIRMLLGTEAGLLDTPEPVVFPVFGRGRALYALVGRGIRRETIDRAATFLIGKCSCQVKDQNPGVDLLLAADWDAMLRSQAAALPDLPSLKELAKAAPVTVTISGNEGDPAASSRRPKADPPFAEAKNSRILFAVLAFSVGVIGFALLLARRR